MPGGILCGISRLYKTEELIEHFLKKQLQAVSFEKKNVKVLSEILCQTSSGIVGGMLEKILEESLSKCLKESLEEFLGDGETILRTEI